MPNVVDDVKDDFKKDRKWKVIGIIVAVLTLLVAVAALRSRSSSSAASSALPLTPGGGLPLNGAGFVQGPTSETPVPGAGQPAPSLTSWIPSPGDLGFLRFASNTAEQTGSHINPHDSPNTETGGWNALYGEQISVLSAPVWSQAHKRWEVQIQGQDVAGNTQSGWVNEADVLSSSMLHPLVSSNPPVGSNG